MTHYKTELDGLKEIHVEKPIIKETIIHHNVEKIQPIIEKEIHKNHIQHNNKYVKENIEVYDSKKRKQRLNPLNLFCVCSK